MLLDINKSAYKINCNIKTKLFKKFRTKYTFNLKNYIKKSLPFSIFIKIFFILLWLFDCRNIGNVIK